jgi:hypothetical protein
VQILDQDLGAVGLEGDAIVAIIDGGVLDDNVAAAVAVGAISTMLESDASGSRERRKLTCPSRQYF